MKFRKAFIVCLVMAVIMTMFYCGPAFAGIGEIFANFKGKFTEIAVEKLVSWGIEILFAILAMSGLGWAVKYKRTAGKLGGVLTEIYQATRPYSPGGAKITGDELDDILAKGGKVVSTAIADTSSI